MRPAPGCSRRRRAAPLSLKLVGVHLRSFSGDYPVCMQVGLAADSRQSYLDYESFADAEADGAYALRQNIRLLPNLFDLGIHEYVRLVQCRLARSRQDRPLSLPLLVARFARVVRDLLDKAGLAIPDERWYSNLKTRGNTGAASIFVMLDDFLRDRVVKPGERILCFVPESGRFTVGYVLFEVVGPVPDADAPPTPAAIAPPPPPHDPDTAQRSADAHAPPGAGRGLARLPLARLAGADRRRASRGETSRTPTSCAGWSDWIPQVQQGSIWMRKAVADLDDRHAALRELVTAHATTSSTTFKILFDDYRRAGGTGRAHRGSAPQSRRRGA